LPTWGEILVEIGKLIDAAKKQFPPPTISPFDVVRRKYLAQLNAHTGRPVILYASKWTQGGADPAGTSMTAEDMHGFMEVMHGVTGPSLDFVIHLPGGTAEATEALVTYVRSKFSDVRVIVPHAAMSAATMFACSAERIVMGKHSFLGPIDPQFIIRNELGVSSVPAHAILEQFAQAQKECKDPSLLPSWLPILRQYGPALIVQCRLAQQLSETLVSDWLARYMFAKTPNGKALAEQIGRDLSNHATFKSHGRFISRDQARGLGLVIDDLESDQKLQDLVLSVFHASAHAFNATPVIKLIENHRGKAYIKQQGMVLVHQGQVPPGVVPPGAGGPPPGPP